LFFYRYYVQIQEKGCWLKGFLFAIGDWPEYEMYGARLWTVTNAGGLLLPAWSPPAGKDESLGSYWEASHCGDHVVSWWSSSKQGARL